MKKVTILAVIIGTLICGCGGGGGSSNAWNGPTNSAGFPDIKGKYSSSNSKTSISCSDGSSSTNDSIGKNIIVSQSDNNISLANEDGSTFVSGGNWNSVSEATGLIQRDAAFQVTQLLDGTVSGQKVHFQITVDGQFLKSGITGELRAHAVYLDLGVTCEYSLTFNGDKL